MVDYGQIIVNLGQSLDSLSRFVQGLSYLLGMGCVLLSLKQFHSLSLRMGNSGGGGSENSFVATCYLVGGACLLFLPTYAEVATNTFFGAGANAMAYDDNWTENAAYGSITYYIEQFIKWGGLVFFIRGTVLLMQASLPGTQHGLKGLVFMLGGIMSMNYVETQALLASIINAFIEWRQSG